MKKFTRIFWVFVFIQLNLATLYAQDRSDIWNEVSETSIGSPKWGVNSMPLNYSTFSLDFDILFSRLQNAPNRIQANSVAGVIVSFPSIKGGFEDFEVYDAPVLHNELQSQLPSARSFVGKSKTNEQKIIRFSMSIMGLKGLILNAEEGTQYIDCLTKDRQFYMQYYKRDVNPIEGQVICLTEEQEFTDEITNTIEDSSFNRNANDGTLRNFRLALACTQEYASYFVGFLNLGSATDEEKKDGILNVMNDIMTRVNAVYENELSITMTIVPNNKNVIFLQDTFLTNNDISLLINESQQWIDVFVAAPNYDIGHMLSTSGSGLAQLRSPCTSNKARAVSGGLGGPPQGVVFENTMMHEMGHQYGAFHTWSAPGCFGTYSNFSAVEPGGGTTIMSYAGICGNQANIQNFADTYFHQISILQMWDRIDGPNGVCASQSSSGNTPPTAVADSDYIIPIGTPYKLVGSGTDANGVASLTYNWEQFDVNGPEAIPSIITTEGPIVRSFPASTNSTRYIPRLEDYVNNVNTSTDWELLTVVNRDLNFALTVRDNDISGGQSDVDFMMIAVDNSSVPFAVTSQNSSGISYEGNSTQTITWNKGNTDIAPFNAANVNILLSTDGGLNFDTVILANTSNDGTEDITLPNIDSTTCRIMVEASDNIFYNINSDNFEIEASLSVDDQTFANSLSIYPNPNTGEFNIRFTANVYDTIRIDVYDIRGRSIFQNNYSNITEFNETIKFNNVQSGVYLLSISNGSNKLTKKIIVN